MAGREPLESWSDEDLVTAAKNGNSEAFMQFCMRGLPNLLRRARFDANNLGYPDCYVSDVCHDAILKGRSVCLDANPPPKNVSIEWLRTIARNMMIDYQRRQGRVFNLEHEDETVPYFPDATNYDEDLEEYRKFFDWLPPNQRDMLEYVLIEGMDITDAGDLLNLKSSAAYKTYERGLKHLKELIEQHTPVTKL